MAWQSIRGHDAIVEGLARAAARDRLAHAYLFVGPAGVGKSLVARQLAKTLLCEAPAASWDSCDHCSACTWIAAGTHPDFEIVRRPDDRVEMPIEVIRNLCDRLALTATRGPRKIAIVEDADDLNEESSNCFLKTLEEPPPKSLLILIGESAERLLPTIRSRCQIVRFAPLTPDVMEEVLQADGIAEAGAARELARQSGGRPGLARELAAADLWTMRAKILTAMADPGASVISLAKELQGLAQSAGKDGGAQRRRASALIELLIEALRQALAPGRSDDAAVAALAREPQDQLLNWLEVCLAAEEQIQRRVQLVLVLEALVDGLMAARAA